MASFKIDEDAYLAHYGILRRSGRYPWGSSGNEQSIYESFIDTIENHRKDGWTEVQIAKAYDISTTELRAAKSIAKNELRAAKISQAQRLKDKGMGNVEIGKKMNLNESSVRSLLEPGKKEKTDIIKLTADMLRQEVEDKKYIDVGRGVENHIGISKTRLNTAVAVLREEGYKVEYIKIPTGPNQFTRQKVLTKKDVTYSELYKDRDNVKQVNLKTEDQGRTFTGKILPPIGVNKNRIQVVYGDEGGSKLDGVIFVRPGVQDISLGNSTYAQVRVLVGKTHYLKGMAMYKDDLPDGVDIQFNTNKKRTNNITDAMKPAGDDPNNPFGAQIARQLTKTDKNGNEKVTSAMNILREEGDWFKWSKSLSPQVLSKQSPVLAKSQLDMTYQKRLQDFEEIMALTNPTIKKRLLETFADNTDASAVHLKAAALPKQITHVILPIASMPKGQIYAPNYENGERVVLIRFPHGGTFEIPELIVNNKHRESRRILGNAKDAVGIHHTVAELLSGADFDGDFVLVIPNNGNKIKTTPALLDLKNFDPQSVYPGYEGMPELSPRRKQTLMGGVSNLITDMTIRNANPTELAQAVRHSMVVIDAEKHNLNVKQSYIDNGIANLKNKYQGTKTSGATTLISRATADTRVPDRKARPAALGGPIDKDTGKKVFVETGESYTDAKGKLVLRTTKSQRLAETDDAFTLSSGTKIESIYAEHSNKLKALANRARKESVSTPRATYSPSAKKVFSAEVASLDASLNIALRNSPLERNARVIANGIVRQKKASTPDMDDATLKKVKASALNDARNRVGAKKQNIVISPSEWKAIQAGAISDSKLRSILDNTDTDVVKKLATPRREILMTSVKTARANSMLASGYTRAEVAKALGVSLTTLDSATV